MVPVRTISPHREEYKIPKNQNLWKVMTFGTIPSTHRLKEPRTIVVLEIGHKLLLGNKTIFMNRETTIVILRTTTIKDPRPLQEVGKVSENEEVGVLTDAPEVLVETLKTTKTGIGGHPEILDPLLETNKISHFKTRLLHEEHKTEEDEIGVLKDALGLLHHEGDKTGSSTLIVASKETMIMRTTAIEIGIEDPEILDSLLETIRDPGLLLNIPKSTDSESIPQNTIVKDPDLDLTKSLEGLRIVMNLKDNKTGDSEILLLHREYKTEEDKTGVLRGILESEILMELGLPLGINKATKIRIGDPETLDQLLVKDATTKGLLGPDPLTTGSLTLTREVVEIKETTIPIMKITPIKGEDVQLVPMIKEVKISVKDPDLLQESNRVVEIPMELEATLHLLTAKNPDLRRESKILQK